MSFREKSIWTCLLSILVINLLYFVQAFRLYGAGEADSSAIVLLYIGAVIVQIVVQIVAHIIFATTSKPEVADERDIAIELKSHKYSHVVLSVGVFLSILGLIAREIVNDAGGPAIPITPFVLGHALLGFFVAAEVLHYATQLFYYRRGV
jgi:hypothetical protein